MYSSLPQRKARRAAARLHKAAAEALPSHVPRQSSGSGKVAQAGASLLGMCASEALKSRKTYHTESKFDLMPGFANPAQMPKQ